MHGPCWDSLYTELCLQWFLSSCTRRIIVAFNRTSCSSNIVAINIYCWWFSNGINYLLHINTRDIVHVFSFGCCISSLLFQIISDLLFSWSNSNLLHLNVNCTVCHTLISHFCRPSTRQLQVEVLLQVPWKSLACLLHNPLSQLWPQGYMIGQCHAATKVLVLGAHVVSADGAIHFLGHELMVDLSQH